MAIREFELFHGVVLTKLVRSDKPVSLRLIEARPNESWSTYTLNDEVDLFVSHSRSPRVLADGGASWSFVFSANQLRQLNSEHRGRPVFAALVCGRGDSDRVKSMICLLEPKEIKAVIDFTRNQQSLTVHKPESRGWLRVYKDRRELFKVPQSRLEKWQIPGA